MGERLVMRVKVLLMRDWTGSKYVMSGRTGVKREVIH